MKPHDLASYIARDLLLQLQQKSFRTQVYGLSSIAWLLFLSFSIVYCQLYDIYVIGTEPSVGSSLLWALREYGLWFAFTPALLLTFPRLWESHKPALLVFLM
jgi:hypothetical protein